MTDNDIITEADIDLRPRDAWGNVYTEADLLSRDEWLQEFQANICCVNGYTRDCSCGGYTDQLPSEASRLLDSDDEPDWEFIAEARAEARSREVELW